MARKRVKTKRPEQRVDVSILRNGSNELFNVLDMTKKYFTFLGYCLRQPFTFIEKINFDHRYLLKNAFTFAIYSTLLYFIVLIPVFIFQDQWIDKYYFFLRPIPQGILYSLGLHLGYKLFGGKGKFKQTLSSLLIMGGVFTPMQIIVYLPIYIFVGPIIYTNKSTSESLEVFNNGGWGWFVYMLALSLFLWTPLMIVYIVKTGKKVHHIGWLKSLAGYYIVMGITVLIWVYIRTPVLNFVDILAKALKNIF